jgi:type I restriction enzyme M protein
VPLKEKVEDYFKREVLPFVPDAWVDNDKEKIGYKVPITRHFYVYEPPKALNEIETDIKKIEESIVTLLQGVTE